MTIKPVPQSELLEDPSVGDLPDVNTSEAILYGSAYSRIKSISWAWDEMEDYLVHKAANLEARIIDRRFCVDVLRTNRYLIFARSPPLNDVSQLKDLFTLRALVRCEAGLKKIAEYRKQNLAWARQRGIQEYVASLSGRGITAAEWKAATSAYNMKPITYDYCHGLGPDTLPHEAFDWNSAMEDIMGEAAYNRLVKNMRGGRTFDPPTEASGDDLLDGSENSSDAPTWWPDLLELIGEEFSDPSKDALSAIHVRNDECQHMSEWLSEADIDYGLLIDRLIAFAKEAAE